MAINNIAINGSSAQGQQLKSWISQYWSFLAATNQLLAQMQAQNDGTTFTALETQFGVPTGQGVNVYGIVFAVGNGNPGSPTGLGAAAFGPISRLD